MEDSVAGGFEAAAVVGARDGRTVLEFGGADLLNRVVVMMQEVAGG